MNRKGWTLFFLIATLILGGCRSPSPLPLFPPSPFPLSPSPPADDLPAVDARAQALLELAMADLARAQDVDADDIFVQSVEQATFSDASLGVPGPGKMYAQVVTPGYVIRLIVAGKVYRYHGSGDRVVLVPDAQAPDQTASQSTTTVTVFFGNQLLNQAGDCNAVFPALREVPDTGSLARAALEQLFAGPTEDEIKKGFVSSFSAATRDILKHLKIKGNTAYVDLVDMRSLMPFVSASCGAAAFFAEVETTLWHAQQIERTIYAIDGDPALFYEWVQLGCSEANDHCDRAPFQPDSSTTE